VKNRVKSFGQFINESRSEEDPIKKLKAISYLHQAGDMDHDRYVRLTIDILEGLGKIRFDAEPTVKVDDTDEGEDGWIGLAQSWSGPAGERLVELTGYIDSVGAGEFSAELNTGMRVKVYLQQGDSRKYEMTLKVRAGERTFTQRADDLMNMEMQWMDSQELIGVILTRATEDYGHFAIDLLIEEL
jgi:hypothetical protein